MSTRLSFKAYYFSWWPDSKKSHDPHSAKIMDPLGTKEKKAKIKMTQKKRI
jgi:hypothetical protein